ncbi:hypothetical protein HCN51_20610 [Nonomuraea sp. FMUSA5-5]|uniref:Uncharacterized protein n=1 Tax=Nonomuraea composti TaxID=2720023 RepID=A0ABX1B4T6_9ACTN|nr:hypothetical protein [Nonomuraea sp. FMUSA5-5]NJP91832.1 hypothetical protein [Nonomuraea sp. FMUSA5-5]
MSKTDKTRPWWVRMADAPPTTGVPRHDHRFGPCTLPDEITADSAGWRPNGCYWGLPGYHVLIRETNAGHREFTYTSREDRRRSRRQARRELRAYYPAHVSGALDAYLG